MFTPGVGRGLKQTLGDVIQQIHLYVPNLGSRITYQSRIVSLVMKKIQDTGVVIGDLRLTLSINPQLRCL
jgi:hypothetical protein